MCELTHARSISRYVLNCAARVHTAECTALILDEIVLISSEGRRDPSAMLHRENGLCEDLGSFLGQIMTDTGNNHPLVGPGEVPLVPCTATDCHYTVSIAIYRDGGHVDRRLFGQPVLDRLHLRIPRNQSVAVPVRVHHDVDEVRVVERRRSALEGRLVEAPVR